MTIPEVLEAAQIGEALGLASCLPDDSDNVFAALTARDLNRELHIVAKANYDESHPKLRRAGADHVLSPSKLAADATDRDYATLYLQDVYDGLEPQVKRGDVKRRTGKWFPK